MKRACILLALIISAISPARAELYLGVNLGPSPIGRMAFSQRTTADLVVDHSTGGMVQGVVGYRLVAPFRIELQAEYFKNNTTGTFRENIQAFIPCGELSGNPCFLGDVRATLQGPAVFAMGFYNMALAPILSLQLGGGVGMQRTDMHVHISGRMNNPSTPRRYDLINSAETVFAARVAAQLALTFRDVDLTLGYSFTRTARPELQGRGAYVPFVFDVPMSRHAILGGVRLPF